MKTLVLNSIIISVIILFSCNNQKRLTERELKKKVSKAGDIEINASKVKLIKKDNYYIAFRKDQEKTFYYLLFPLGKEYQISQIITQKPWFRDDLVNKSIIDAYKNLDSLNLLIDLIYDYEDSVGLILIDKQMLFRHSSYYISGVDSLPFLYAYRLDTCFIKDCDGRYLPRKANYH